MSATTFNKKILHVILFMVLIPFNFAYPSCSSFLSSSIILPETFTRLSEGCSLTVQDEFTIELPLSLSSFPQLTQFNLDISNDKDSFHAKLIPHFSNKAYTFEVSHEGQQEQYELQSGDQALILTVKDGTYILNVKNLPINTLRSLKRGSVYTLTLHFSHQELLELKKHTSFRNLDQCPADYFLVEGTCMRVCPAKQFNNSGACTRCSDKCSSGRCISADKCNPCKSNEVFSQELNSCVEKCPENFFEDLNNKVCVKCSDGCKTCNFPNGLCSASNFKTDMLINLAVSFILLTLITLCACYSNKDKTEPEKATADLKGEQKQEDKTPQIKTKGNSDHIKKIVGADPQAPYLVLSEGINYDDEGQDAEDKDPELKKKRLTAYAESKLLYLSVQKGFMIDDADEERAISHGSGSKLNHRIASISTLSCKTESPLYKPKRRDSKNVQQSSFAPDRKSRLNTEDTPTLHANTYGELGSPYSGLSGLGTKKEPSLGLMAAARKKESTDATLFFELLDEQGAGKEGQYLKPPPEIPETENSRVTIKEEEVMEEIQEIDEEREGYKCDSSISMSKETERASELYTCPICSMNKRDCLNKPCGHVAGCYSCMEQYKESYGVCPRCKKYLANIEKIDSEENKEMKAPQETKNNKKDKTIGGLLDRY